MKYVTKPVEIRAHQWTGSFDSYRSIAYLVGISNVRHPDSEKDYSLEVYNHLSKVWLPVHNDEFVILGIEHEAYPCNPDVFNRKYQLANVKARV